MPPCPAPDTCRLYLVRHGATDFNGARPPRLQGRRIDLPLSDEGFEQARLTGRRLADEPLDAVYSSPLLRAQQTALAIAAPHGLTIRLLDDLIEVDVGAWEGRTWEQIAEIDPKAYQRFTADASVHAYMGGENLTMVLQRVLPALERLMAENLGRLVVVVAHNVVNRVYLAHLLGIPLAQYRSVVQDNGAISVIEYRQGEATPMTINDVGHLGKAEGGGRKAEGSEPEA